MATIEEGAILEEIRIVRQELSALSQALAAVNKKVDNLNRKADKIIMSQSDADALGQRLEADEQSELASLDLLGTGIQELKDELAAAQQGNPGVDLSGISAKVDALDGLASRLSDAAGSVPQPPPPPAPAPCPAVHDEFAPRQNAQPAGSPPSQSPALH